MATRLHAPRPPPTHELSDLDTTRLNYRDHAAEAGLALPDTPSVFTEFRSSIIGPTGEIVLPADTVDWEAELVVDGVLPRHRLLPFPLLDQPKELLGHHLWMRPQA